ncbi:AMP-binding protein [Streptomyces stramineus]
MEMNLADLFESIVDTVPGREALVHLDHPGSGAERRSRTRSSTRQPRLAHHLRDSGVGPGEHVGLHLYNGVEYLQTLWACLKIRAVPVNVNYRYVEEELSYLYRDADLVALVFDAEFTGRVAAALPPAAGSCGTSSGPGHRPRVRPCRASSPSPSPRRRRRGPPPVTSVPAPVTTGSSSTPAAPPGCPRAWCGGRRTCSSPAWAAGRPPGCP